MNHLGGAYDLKGGTGEIKLRGIDEVENETEGGLQLGDSGALLIVSYGGGSSLEIEQTDRRV